ncbi:MAG: hypothetical protein QXD61_08925 [Candidatus Caldarchaeum sp.]
MRDRRQLRAVSSLLFSILVVLMLVLGFSSSYSLQPAQVPPTLGSFGTATVDGVLSPGEYGSCIGPVTLPLGGTQYTIIFCETNDATNDYYYFEINDLTELPGGDRFYLLFDNNNDDVIPACGAGLPVEDAIGFIMPPPSPLPSPLIDMNYCGLPSTGQPPAGPDPVGSQHINGMWSFTPGVGYRFEFSHPLNSGDSEDYALSIGSTVGWCIYYRDGDKPPPNIVDYPRECYYRYAATGKADLYGHVIKLREERTTGTTVTTTITTTVRTTTTTTITRPTTVTTTTTSVTTSTTTATTTITTTRPTTIMNTTTVTTTTTSVTTSTTTATTTTIQVSTVTSITTRTLETTTTATTTSIVIDPMLEIKLYILIGLVLAIIGIITWMIWKCCKKKVALEPPMTPTPPPEPPPPQPPQEEEEKG